MLSRLLEHGLKAVGDYLRGGFRWHRLVDLAVAVTHLDRAVVDGVAARDGDDRHADELGVLELDARRDLLAVVEDDLDAAALEFGHECFGGFERLLVLAGGHDVHLGGCDVRRPCQATVVVVRLRDASSATSVSAASNACASLPVATMCTWAGAMFAGHARPRSSWCVSAMHASTRLTPMP